jgi:hypothetical protein
MGTAQRGNNWVTQMRGRAAAIGRGVNRCTIGDHRKSGGQLRGKQDGDVGSAQSDQSAGGGDVHAAALCAESQQLYRESDHRFDALAKPVGRQQIPHFASPHPLQLLGFEDMILLRTGGLAASPPVRYTLETAEEYLARYGRATRMR